MPTSRSDTDGFFQEIMNTVWPESTSHFTMEFFGDRSRM